MGALAIAQVTSAALATIEHGIVCKTKRVIMDRDLYQRQWGKGPTAVAKKALVASGQLDKYGRPNEQTPSSWLGGYNYLDAKTGQSFTPKISDAAPPAKEVQGGEAAEKKAKKEKKKEKKEKKSEKKEKKSK